MDDYGHRLLPSVLHHEAQLCPERSFAIVPRSNRTEDGFQTLTFRQVDHAVNHLASWLLTQFPQVERLETIAYMGVTDVRYCIMFYAAVQCRLKVFLPSPRNPVEVNVSLFEATQCSKLVYTPGIGNAVEALRTNPSLNMVEIPSLEDFLAGPSLMSTYDLEYKDVYREPIVILHSSGSTGLPKPITMTHGTLATYDIRNWPTVNGRMNHDCLQTLRFVEAESRAYDVFPPFHIAGFTLKIALPVYNLTVPIYGPAFRPPSGALAAELIGLHKPRAAILPPTITEQLYHDADGLALLKTLDVLLYAGGPLAEPVGAELSKHTKLCQFYGSTDMGQIRQLLPLRDDWAYIEFHPHERFEMQPYGDGMFELVVFADKDLVDTSSLYHNFPDIQEWHTKDLFEPHPEKCNLWKFATRTDDILVFSSGEKLNPIPMESMLSAVAGVRGALVVGQKQPQSALLLELGPEHSFSTDPLEDLWPAVNRANDLLPFHGRVSRSMIIISGSDKTFVRAGKGTVVRRLTEQLYENEIRNVFASAKTGSMQRREQPLASILKPTVDRIDDVKTLLRTIFREVSMPEELDDQSNVYAHGMDSIRTLEVIGHLRSHLAEHTTSKDMAWLSRELLYRNPTIDELARILVDFLNTGAKPRRKDRVQEIRAQIDACIRRLPAPVTRPNRKSPSNLKLAITGTTGFLGHHLVAHALGLPNVAQIWCLNRSEKASETFQRRSPGANQDKLKFLHVDLSAADLGLGGPEYQELQERCDMIIHNAWAVDFNLGLASFADNIASIEHLIRLSASSRKAPRMVFISSISATGVWSPPGSAQYTVPAAIADDPAQTMELGYAESKYVAERIIGAAAEAGIPASIVRAGLLAPSTTRASEGWPENDTARVFLHTCRSLGLVANDFVGLVDWVPVDVAAAAVLDVVRGDVHVGQVPTVCNLVHPRPLPWTELIPPVLSWCGAATQTVSMREWIQSLRAIDLTDGASLRRFPALRVPTIFELMAQHGPFHVYETGNLLALSPTMAALPPIDARQMRRWLQTLD